MKIEGKTVILTGTASGIGKAILDLLKAKNCKIIAADVAYEAEVLVEGNTAYLKCDLTDTTQLEHLFTFSQAQYGKPDIFIANAGFAYFGKTESLSDAQITRIFHLNTISTITAASKMKLINGSRPFNMVIMASAMAYWPVPGYAVYSATKAALRAFAKAYRYELVKGQRLQLVYPIGTRTDFFAQAGHSPEPLISQSAAEVAAATIHGIERNSSSIFPSFVFWLSMLANRLLPFISPIVLWIEFKKFQKWIKENKETV
jgi:short-subunit dehydrogenase